MFDFEEATEVQGMAKANGSLQITSFTEDTYEERGDKAKLTRGDWTIIPGSGTDDLKGITGSGTFEAPGGPKASYELDYDLG